MKCLNAKARGIDVQLFVRKNKDDKISKELEIEWALDTPVREDIYEYIVNG